MLKQILTIEKEGAHFDYMIRIGRKPRYDYYYTDCDDGILVASGIFELPPIQEALDLEPSEFAELYQLKNLNYNGNNEKFKNFIKIFTELNDELKLPFETRDYQLLAPSIGLTKEIAILKMCTGSGKSLTISLILEYFRRQNLKGALIVPNINLLTQFANDIKSYNLNDLHKTIIKVGGQGKRTRDPNTLQNGEFLLTTWQSLKNLDDELMQSLDFIICDEVHRFSSECTSKLVLDSINAKYKLGFTGSLPASKNSKLTLYGLFGLEFNIIESADLIRLGMGTPIKIHSTKLIHTADNSYEISKYMDYLERVKFLANLDSRNEIISKLAKNLQAKNLGGTLVLYTLIDHGVKIYKGITGEEPSTLERQKELGVFFMEGSVKAKEREEMRQLMDSMSNAIMIANYSLLSTGVNIKSLRYAIFAAPLKSYTAIVQSLGRGIRTAEGKDLFEVYDIVDHFPGGPSTFNNSSRERKKIYASQKFEYVERKVNLSY